MAQQEMTSEKVQEIEHILSNYDELEARLSPHFDNHIEFLKANFPNLFRKSLAQALREQVENSNEEIIQALSPIIGKMIARYIRNEFEKLSQRIDEAQKDFFSLHSWKLRAQSFFTGVPYEELILRETVPTLLQEVFLIENESGLLVGHHSVNDLMDPDMIAGMLTGIKGFVEHAFQQDKQALEMVKYEDYKILIHPFFTYYLAIVVSGPVSLDFRSRTEATASRFMEEAKLPKNLEITGEIQDRMSEKLKLHFHGLNPTDQ